MGVRTVKVSGFPNNITAEKVKVYLENHTSAGSVQALKVRPHNRPGRNSYAFVVVQFVDSFSAEKVKRLANGKLLYYGSSYLKVQDAERDIEHVPKPRVPMFEVPKGCLHFGCQVAKNKLSVLCRVPDVAVQFGSDMRKIHYFLTWGDISYKLELSYESIWEIQLHRCAIQRRDYLLFQVSAAPKIYRKVGSPLGLVDPDLCLKVSSSLGLVYGDPSLNFSKAVSDDQWVRTTDFSGLGYIGQSSTLCVELAYKSEMPDIGKYFVYFKEFSGPFYLEKGWSYSCAGVLVPIVQPHLVDVPYRILFKVNHMVQNGILSGPTLDDNFYRLICPHYKPISLIERALEDLSYSKVTCFDPTKWLVDRYAKYRASFRSPKSAYIDLGPGLVYVHRVQITPSKVYFYGPEINVSNRVLRNYEDYLDNFIRISFVDEDCDKMHSTHLAPKSDPTNRTEIYGRILSTLKNGIVLGNKKFEFLAFSSSQLRDNSAWMFASERGLTASTIREWMGNFSMIRNVAKYAARLGQSFSSSTETLTVERHETEMIPDIKNFKYVFSDGIGKISAAFAKRVAVKCGFKGSTPSAFQIRYGGYKGVVAVDPTSTFKLSLRSSMSKFDSVNLKLDVLAYTKYQPCFLNRQLITLLSTLGVQDHIFEKKQDEAIDQLNMILMDPKAAEEALDLMFPGEITNVLKEMLLSGYKPDSEPFLSMMLQTFRATKLLELRTKSRIYLPRGRAMMGCLDETRTLEYGQAFIQLSCSGSRQFLANDLFWFTGSESEHRTVVLKGKVVVAKNPCLHPGDVRVLDAVDVPDLHHMVDCVVFPQKGHRPHPNECSGSDLDGDIYFVSWDIDLIPPRQVPPMEYTPAPAETLDHDVTIEEVEEYFTNYIVNDSLGIIANAHTVFADKELHKAESEPCIELARLFSIAVDFPKTGVPAEIPPHLQVKEYPDFMEKLDKVTYDSSGVIGKLFRQVRDQTPHSGSLKTFTKEVAAKSYDPDMEVDGFMDYVEEALWFKGEYDFKLGNLMDHYGIKTEGELLTGNLMRQSKTFNKYRDGEAVVRAVKSLRKEMRDWFEENSEASDLSAKASACYHVTYHSDYWGHYIDELKRPHFLSFPWCVYDRLIRIKSQNKSRRAAAEMLRKRFASLWLS